MEEPSHRKFWFEPKISVGDVLLAVGFAIGGLSSFFILSERVSVNYAEFKAHKEAQAKLDAERMQEFRETRLQAQQFRAEIINQLEKLNNNVVLLRERVAQGEGRSYQTRPK